MMDVSMERNFGRIFLALLVVGLVLNIYVFSHPFNTIADEEEYLQEAFSLASGQPTGWNLRSFVPQFILFIPALIAKFLGVTSPEAVTLGIRTVNWIYWWIGLLLVYKIGKRTFDVPTAAIATVLLSLNWVWMLNSRRVMMDVPSAVWMLAAIYIITVNKRSFSHCISVVFAAGMASATKFQMGPLAALLIVIFSTNLIQSKDWKNLAVTFVASGLFTLAFGLTDRLIYGQWFGSLLNFYDYTFVNKNDFSTTYGACEPSLFYLTESRNIFSYIFPFFIVFGTICLLINARVKERALIAVAIIAYLVLIQNICHKQVRYLLAILPLLILVGAYGIVRFFVIFRHIFEKIPYIQMITVLGMNSTVILIAVSMISKDDLRNMNGMKETCSSFIYTSVRPELITGGFSIVLLGTPCGIPSHFIRPLIPVYGGVGFNELSRKKQLSEFRTSLKTVRAVVVERGSLLENILHEEWGDTFSPFKISKFHQYALYIKP
jgi:hypothetical protein